MKEYKKLQKQLKKELDTPEVPFEEWAAKRGIFSDTPDKAECPVYEPAENVSGRSTGNGSKKKLLLICMPILAVFIVLAILLGCLLPRSFAPKIYGANDVERVETTLEEITNQEGIYLFDMSDVADMGTVNKDILLEDKSRVMLYTLNNCLLSVGNGEEYDGFYLTYSIRTYSNYEFIDLVRFTKLENSVTVQNKKVEYRIAEDTQPTAYARFTVGKYEYFIEAYGFQDVTVLNEENFLNLLNKVLI